MTKKSEYRDVLDHGYVEVMDWWGSDECIIEAARMSTQKGFEGWGPKCVACGTERGPSPDGFATRDIACACGSYATAPGDEKLLTYLWKNAHQTPFEMCGLTIEVQAPIFVFREWHRHRVPFGYNEASARYSPLPDMNYVPTVDRLMMGASSSNKQAGTVKGSDSLSLGHAENYRSALVEQYVSAERLYQTALAMGVPKELARIHLPVGRYSKMRATSNLRGWLSFLTLRMNLSAQWEIRQYANAVGDFIADKFPRTWELFQKGRSEQ